MRLFIAIELSREMREAIAGLQSQMRSQHISGWPLSAIIPIATTSPCPNSRRLN